MSPKAKQRAIRLALILSLIAGICLFLVGALRENIVYFKTPSELLVLADQPKKLRVGYSGRLPDLFRENQGIVAIGTYDSSKKIFTATQLLAKHDQYYRPPLKK